MAYWGENCTFAALATFSLGLAVSGGVAAAGSITRSGTTWTIGNGPTITEAGAATLATSVSTPLLLSTGALEIRTNTSVSSATISTAGAWTFPVNTTHTIGSAAGAATTVLKLQSEAAQNVKIDYYNGATRKWQLYNLASNDAFYITANSVDCANCTQLGAWTFPVSVTIGTSSGQPLSVKSTDSRAQIVFGRTSTEVGWGYIGANSTNAVNIYAGGTGATPSVGDLIASATQAGAWTLGNTATALTHTVNGSMTLGTGSIYGVGTSINDDAATSFAPGQNTGVIMISARSGAYMTVFALVAYNADASPATALLLDPGTLFAVTTGALAGTTGTDGKFTVSAHTDGLIYLENRLGGARAITYTLLGSA